MEKNNQLIYITYTTCYQLINYFFIVTLDLKRIAWIEKSETGERKRDLCVLIAVSV